MTRRTDAELLEIADRNGATADACMARAAEYRHRAATHPREPWRGMAEECEKMARLLIAREAYSCAVEACAEWVEHNATPADTPRAVAHELRRLKR